jgi:hypothetical protein
MKVRLDCTVSFGEESLTADKAEVEVIDQDEGDRFLNISLKDSEDVPRKASIIISADDLKRILEVAEAGHDPQKDVDELVKRLREHGKSEKAIRAILRWYGLRGMK